MEEPMRVISISVHASRSCGPCRRHPLDVGVLAGGRRTPHVLRGPGPPAHLQPHDGGDGAGPGVGAGALHRLRPGRGSWGTRPRSALPPMGRMGRDVPDGGQLGGPGDRGRDRHQQPGGRRTHLARWRTRHRPGPLRLAGGSRPRELHQRHLLAPDALQVGRPRGQHRLFGRAGDERPALRSRGAHLRRRRAHPSEQVPWLGRPPRPA